MPCWCTICASCESGPTEAECGLRDGSSARTMLRTLHNVVCVRMIRWLCDHTFAALAVKLLGVGVLGGTDLNWHRMLYVARRAS